VTDVTSTTMTLASLDAGECFTCRPPVTVNGVTLDMSYKGANVGQ